MPRYLNLNCGLLVVGMYLRVGHLVTLLRRDAAINHTVRQPVYMALHAGQTLCIVSVKASPRDQVIDDKVEILKNYGPCNE